MILRLVMNMKKRKKIVLEDLVLDIFIYAILLVLLVVFLYPVWYTIVASFATSDEVQLRQGMMLWPKNFTTGAYKLVLENRAFMTGFRQSVLLLLGGLPINIVMTLLCGYFMAKRNMFWKKPIIAMIMFTMFFSGGMIPNYLNVKSLGLLDSLWSLILPGAISVYNAIICKTAIEAIPESLSESAHIDGANSIQVLWKIIVPLLKPTLAVLLLYYGVAHWNAWFNASLYITTEAKLPIQNILRNVLEANKKANESVAVDVFDGYADTIQYAAIVVSTFPIMCVYPFLQKYFAKGAMIGAVKG